eukprot:653452-Pyramimonas_sp.AAC.1
MDLKRPPAGGVGGSDLGIDAGSGMCMGQQSDSTDYPQAIGFGVSDEYGFDLACKRRMQDSAFATRGLTIETTNVGFWMLTVHEPVTRHRELFCHAEVVDGAVLQSTWGDQVGLAMRFKASVGVTPSGYT